MFAIAYTSRMTITVEDYSAGVKERIALFKCFRWDIGHDILIPVFQVLFNLMEGGSIKRFYSINILLPEFLIHNGRLDVFLAHITKASLREYKGEQQNLDTIDLGKFQDSYTTIGDDMVPVLFSFVNFKSSQIVSETLEIKLKSLCLAT